MESVRIQSLKAQLCLRIAIAMPTLNKVTLYWPKKVNTLNLGPESPLRWWNQSPLRWYTQGPLRCLKHSFSAFPLPGTSARKVFNRPSIFNDIELPSCQIRAARVRGGGRPKERRLEPKMAANSNPHQKPSPHARAVHRSSNAHYMSQKRACLIFAFGYRRIISTMRG